MTDEFSDILITDPNQPNAPPYRPFRSRPSGVYIQAVVDRLKETGEPEKIVGLYRGKIDRDARFRILRKVSISRKKRPLGDMVHCPRCGCDDKFLEGAFAWFHELQYCAVIGHCCAGHEALDEAEREFKWREKRDYEENYLLEGLPNLRRKAELLSELRSPAGEAQRLYRQFRNKAAEIHRHLRDIKAQRGGHLRLIEILGSTEADSEYVGPAGFRGRGGSEVESRDIDLGYMVGVTAVSKDYSPIKQLDETLRVLDSFDVRVESEDQALDLIVGMDERRRRAAVAILKAVDHGYEKFARKLSDFWAFFTRENIERLNAYGTHAENPFHFEASYRAEGGRTMVTLKRKRKECRLLFDDRFASLNVDWPK
jgi:hypothetical protein